MGAAEALGGSVHYRLEHALRILIEIVVPDAQDRPAFLREECVATLVPVGFGMLAAVQLNDELRPAAGEIGEVRADRQLTRELGSQARNHRPEFGLMPRCMRAQSAGASGLVERNASAHACGLQRRRASRTHPRPLPSRGGELKWRKWREPNFHPRGFHFVNSPDPRTVAAPHPKVPLSVRIA